VAFEGLILMYKGIESIYYLPERTTRGKEEKHLITSPSEKEPKLLVKSSCVSFLIRQTLRYKCGVGCTGCFVVASEGNHGSQCFYGRSLW